MNESDQDSAPVSSLPPSERAPTLLSSSNTPSTERSLRLLFQVTRAVAEADDYQIARQQVLTLLCEALGWTYGEVWLPDPATNVLRRGGEWFGEGASLELFREASATMHFSSGDGLPGRVWAYRQPEWIADVTAEPALIFQRARLATAADLHAALAVPVLDHDDVLAIFVFFAQAAVPEQQSLVELSTLAVAQLGGALRRLRVHEALREREAQLSQLNEELEQRVGERTQALRQMNAQLERAARLKDEFLAMMSHELRTPLNSILAYAESCSEGVYGAVNERQQHALTGITESGRHLLTLINDILDMVKIEAGQLKLMIEPIALEELCAASLRMIRQLAGAKRLQFTSSGVDQVDEIQGDHRRLKQVLVNLLVNAIKFTPSGGKIGLEVRGDEVAEEIHFTVWDTGIGIAVEDLPQLFKPFVQLDRRLSRSHEGSGLGLTLVSRLVDLHGGRVTVESVLGQGSRFTITLPWRRQVAEQTPSVVSEPAALTSPIAFGGTAQAPLLLLVDDNELVRRGTSDYLVAQGYRVVVASNGDEALATIREMRPDLVLMDIQMPVMDGLEAIRRIRAEPAIAAIPVVTLTALVMPGDKERSLAAGANAYLAKPVKLQLLAGIVAAILSSADRPEEAQG